MAKKLDVESLSDFNPAHYLYDHEEIKAYIQAVKEEGDPAAISEALSTIFLALGVDVRQIRDAQGKLLEHPETLRSIHTEEGFNHIVTFMNKLVDVVGDNEEHPLASLLDLVSDVVSSYESVHHKI